MENANDWNFKTFTWRDEGLVEWVAQTNLYVLLACSS